LEGHERHPDLTYPDDQFVYYFCAKEFGWTIEETDNQPAAMVDWLMSIDTVMKQVESDKH
jgi:hypothetical protein